MNILLKPRFLHYVKECEKKLKFKVKNNSKHKPNYNTNHDTTENNIELDNASDISESSKLTAEEFAKAVGIDIFNRKDYQKRNCIYRKKGLFDNYTIDYADIDKECSSVFDESFFKNPLEEETDNAISNRRRSASTSALSSFNIDSNIIYENNIHPRFKRKVSTNSAATCINSNYSDYEYPDNDNSVYLTNERSFNSSFLSSSSQYTLKNSFTDNQNVYYNSFSYHSLPYRKTERPFIQNEDTIHSSSFSFKSSTLPKSHKYKITTSVTFNEGTRYFEVNVKPKIPDEIKIYRKGRFTVTREISGHSLTRTN